MTFISYAQNYEDVMLYRALKHIDKGFYVDVGAGDPIFDSVTQAFYERGWQGINIEPLHSYYERLCYARPLDINLSMAAADEEGELTFYEIPETGLSTLDQETAEKQRLAGWGVTERKVSVLTLNQILEKHVNCPIHFLKIDVEGAEKAVLQGLDLTRWRPWILVIEATVPMSQELNFNSWELLVTAAEYEMVYFDGLNRFYVAQEQIALAELFKIPPNVFDDFFPHSDDYLSTRYENMLIEVDRIRSELDGISGELSGVRLELDGVRGERDVIRSELDGVCGERDVIRSELEVVREEIDGIRSELEVVREERDGIRSELDEVREERNVIRSELDEVHGDLRGVRLELDGVRGERDDNRAMLDEVWADRDQILIRLDDTRTDREQIRKQLDEVWAERNKYWSELDVVYRSLLWRLFAPFRALFRNIHFWKDRISRILHQPFSYNVAKILSRIEVILRRTSWGVSLLNKFTVWCPKLWFRVVTWMKLSTPTEPAQIPPINFASNDELSSKNEKHFLDVFQRELFQRQDNIEDNK